MEVCAGGNMIDSILRGRCAHQARVRWKPFSSSDRTSAEGHRAFSAFIARTWIRSAQVDVRSYSYHRIGIV